MSGNIPKNESKIAAVAIIIRVPGSSLNSEGLQSPIPEVDNIKFDERRLRYNNSNEESNVEYSTKSSESSESLEPRRSRTSSNSRKGKSPNRTRSTARSPRSKSLNARSLNNDSLISFNDFLLNGEEILQSGEILYIRRTIRNSDPWSGHMAFPGGLSQQGENEIDTACRETLEEIGMDLNSDDFIPIGQLSNRPIHRAGKRKPSLILTPFVFLQVTKKDIPLILQEGEVASAHWIPINFFLGAAEDTKRWRKIPLKISSFIFPSKNLLRLANRGTSRRNADSGTLYYKFIRTLSKGTISLIRFIRPSIDYFFGSCSTAGILLPLQHEVPGSPKRQAEGDVSFRKTHRTQLSTFSLINPPLYSNDFFSSDTSTTASNIPTVQLFSKNRSLPQTDIIPPSPVITQSDVYDPQIIDTKDSASLEEQEYEEVRRPGQSSRKRLLLWGLTLGMSLDLLENLRFNLESNSSSSMIGVARKPIKMTTLRNHSEFRFEHKDVQLIFNTVKYLKSSLFNCTGLFYNKPATPNIIRNTAWSSTPIFDKPGEDVKATSSIDSWRTGRKKFHLSAPEMRSSVSSQSIDSDNENYDDHRMHCLHISDQNSSVEKESEGDGIQWKVIGIALLSTILARGTAVYLLYKACHKAYLLLSRKEEPRMNKISENPFNYSKSDPKVTGYMSPDNGISTSVVETTFIPKKRVHNISELSKYPIDK